MAVAASYGDTSSHILAVVPKVHCKDRLCLAVLTDLVVHHLTLLCRCHQFFYRSFSHRHVSEEPCKLRPHIDHLVEIFFASDHLRICGSIAAGNAKGQFSLFQNIHSMDDFLVSAISSSGIRRIFKSLDTDGRHEVLHPQHFVCKRLIDQRSVCECREYTVRVFLTETDDIFLSHQWLSTSKQIDVCTESNSLIDDIVHLFIGQVHMVSILCRPAAGAFQVACTGGIQKDGPGDIAVIFLFIILLPLIPQQTTVDDQVFKHPVSHARINVRPQAHYKLMPVVILIQHYLPDSIPLFFQRIFPVKPVKPIQKFRQVFLRILIHI